MSYIKFCISYNDLLYFDECIWIGDANAEAGYSLVATQVPCGVNPTGHSKCEF